MSDEQKDQGPLTTRLLIIAGVIAVIAAGAVYYFHGEYEATLSELETAKKNYDHMKKMGVEVVRLHKIKKEQGKSDTRQSPPIVLAQIFTSRGFDRDRFKVTQLRPNPLEGWKETLIVVDFPSKRDQDLQRAQLIDALSQIERKYSYIKSRDLTFRFVDNDILSAKITFVTYERD